MDDMICDLLVALSRKSVKGDRAKERRLIERTASQIIEFCDRTQPMRVSASENVRLT